MHKLLRLLSVGVMLLTPLFIVPEVFAASATMSLSPASGNEAQGSNFTVNVYENSGSEPVNAVTANLSYPSDLLSFVGVDSSSAFSVDAGSSGGGGSVNIDRGALPSATGNARVASVRFKVLASSGVANITFSGSDKVVSAKSHSDILTGTSGGSYSLTAAGSNGAVDTNMPAITNVQVGDVQMNSVTITWTTSKPATSEVNYGLNSGYGLSAGDGSFVTAHKLTLRSALLVPGTQYHFVVKSVDSSGNAATSKDQTFTTKGATLVVRVVDQKNKPVSQVHVAVGNTSGVTDKQGQVTLTGFQLGKTVAVVTYRGQKRAVDIEVKPVSGTTPQSVTVAINKPTINVFLIVVSLLVLAGLVLLLLYKNGNFKNKSKT